LLATASIVIGSVFDILCERNEFGIQEFVNCVGGILDYAFECFQPNYHLPIKNPYNWNYQH